MLSDPIFYIYTLLTLCLGSTISALSWRWQRSAEHEWRKDAHEFLELDFAETSPPDFFSGRSECPHCHHTLAIRDLIPFISYMLNKGKCRYCSQSISLRYPLIELATAGALIPLYFFGHISYLEWGLQVLLISALLCALVIDAESYWLPDECHFAVGVCAVLLMGIQSLDAYAHLVAALFSYLFIYLLRFLFLRLRNVEAIGLGDAKLLAALMLWLGFKALPPILLLSSIGGIVFAIVTRRKFTHKIPFGPFLILAALYYFYSGLHL